MKHKLLLLIYILITFSLFPVVNTNNEDKVKVHLVTLGPGDELFLRWGHFGILIDYPVDSKNLDIFYDYGTFSFNQRDFFKNFINGVMTYSKEKYYASYVLNYYIKTNRTIVLQELNLTEKQVNMYIDKLNTEVLPKNKFYQYDQYRNNCVSEMVKYLNELTDGAFLHNSSGKTGRSFRDYSRDYVSSNYLNNLLIMFVLGSKVEYNVTEEESLFLPDYTMERADKIFITDSNGNSIPLIKNKIILNESTGRDPIIVNSKPKYLLNTIFGIIIGLLILLLSRYKKAYKIAALISGLILGTVGIIFFFMAFFTGHYYIHQNWNLLFIHPLTLIVAVGGILSLTRKFRDKGLKIIQLYIDVTLILTVGMIVMKIMGLIYQQNGEIICLFLPILLINSSFKYLVPVIKKEA